MLVLILTGTPSIQLPHNADTNYNYDTVQDAGLTDASSDTDHRGLCAGVHYEEYSRLPRAAI